MFKNERDADEERRKSHQEDREEVRQLNIYHASPRHALTA